ncbi:hypothetical protein D3P96_00460 [Weissella viridescens]|uniref:Uncharacterized protein n=1 Tax=Weissella viridescens TaxID=1629 RepID=A0A3P2RG73_WEIVI|nr:hypothetical protein [Weissella viridescens]RRG18495.1 hypothetical protein D3P96_00460 [Weissella viridescens]
MDFKKVPFEKNLIFEVNETFQGIISTIDATQVGHLFFWGELYGDTTTDDFWYVNEENMLIEDSKRVGENEYILSLRMSAEVFLFEKMFSDHQLEPYIHVLIDFDMTGSQVVAKLTFDRYDWRHLNLDLSPDAVWDYYTVETVGPEYLENDDNLADIHKMQEYADKHDETLHYQVFVDDSE